MLVRLVMSTEYGCSAARAGLQSSLGQKECRFLGFEPETFSEL